MEPTGPDPLATVWVPRSYHRNSFFLLFGQLQVQVQQVVQQFVVGRPPIRLEYVSVEGTVKLAQLARRSTGCRCR